MGQIVCFANNKGGVGKTTTAVAMGYAWAKMGKKVLFVDLDSQANLTAMVSPLALDEHESSIRDAFLDKSKFAVEHAAERVDLVPSELSLSNFDRDTAAITGREYLLLDLLKPLKTKYDFIIIDCPPALGLITYNALIASDHLVMVATPDGLAYQGMVMVANLYADVKSNPRLNPDLKLTGVIISKYERNKLSDMYVEKIRQEMGDSFIEPVLSKATKIAQAGSFNQNIYEYDPSGKVTKQYLEIAQTLGRRISGCKL
ncbi:MAG: ParA family protein [Bacteroidales bacterium]|nr:ParA family protein [Bacteroidales bacterium]